MGQKENDLQRIKELIKIMKENDLIEVEIKHNDDKILLKRAGQQPPTAVTIPIAAPPIQAAPKDTTAAQGPAPQTQQEDENLVEIKSPIVGTYYAKPSPNSELYVEIGSAVEPQTVICIIEAMKVMNEIKAETTGTIAEILVTNGQAVEYGQVLFRVKPD